MKLTYRGAGPVVFAGEGLPEWQPDTDMDVPDDFGEALIAGNRDFVLAGSTVASPPRAQPRSKAASKTKPKTAPKVAEHKSVGYVPPTFTVTSPVVLTEPPSGPDGADTATTGDAPEGG